MIVPSVFVAPNALEKMKLWAQMAGEKKREFICFGTVDYNDWLDGYYIDEVYLVKQEGSSASIEADDKDMADLTYKLFSEGIDPARLRAWIHSHPGTGPQATYLSGTDEQMVSRWLNGDFLISIVWDSNGENPYTRVDLKRPRVNFETNIELSSMGQEEWESAVEEFKEKSKSKKYTYFNGTGVYSSKGYSNQYGKYKDGKWKSWKEIDDGKSKKKKPKKKKAKNDGKGGGDKKAKEMLQYEIDIEEWEDLEDWDPVVSIAGKKSGDLAITNGYLSEDTGPIIISDIDDDFENGVAEVFESEIEAGKQALRREIDDIVQGVQMGHLSKENAVDFLVALGFGKDESIEYIKSELGL